MHLPYLLTLENADSEKSICRPISQHLEGLVMNPKHSESVLWEKIRMLSNIQSLPIWYSPGWSTHPPATSRALPVSSCRSSLKYYRVMRLFLVSYLKSQVRPHTPSLLQLFCGT